MNEQLSRDRFLFWALSRKMSVIHDVDTGAFVSAATAAAWEAWNYCNAPVDGDWYTSEFGTACVDWVHPLTKNQLSIMLFTNGTIGYSLRLAKKEIGTSGVAVDELVLIEAMELFLEDDPE